MAHWLVKTEPTTWSWTDHVKAGTSAWTGVRNPAAQKNLRAMARGDRVFFYHTGDEKQIVGIAEVTRAAFPDPTDKTGKSVAIDLKTVTPLKTPVTLARVKGEPAMADFLLVKQSRLSVMPVPAEVWKMICAWGGVKP